MKKSENLNLTMQCPLFSNYSFKDGEFLFQAPIKKAAIFEKIIWQKGVVSDFDFYTFLVLV